MSIGASEHRTFVRERRVSPAKRLRDTVLSVEMLFYRTYCHVSLPAFSPISVMTSWPAWAAMAGGHNRRGSTEGVGHARRSWNAVRDDYPRPSLAESAARALPFPKSQRPTCPFSFAPGGTPPARPSATSASARCESFPTNRLTPAPCDSGSWPSTMAAGAWEQAASCDAFVLSRRPPAPGAPPSRTSPLCLIAKAPLQLSPNHGPVTSGRAGTAAANSVKPGQGHHRRTAFWPWSA